jgi:hypothetical protein
MSTGKTKIMASKGRDPVRNENAINNIKGETLSFT